MNKSCTIPAPYHFRDLAEGIQQQMFFWGQDVLHPSGNLLRARGFERSPSTGIKGTSCYRRDWQGGHIELYGSCAGWYGEGRGFVFIRPKRKCVVWLSSDVTPIPGEWQKELIARRADRAELYQLSKPFFDWLFEYEASVIDQFGPQYRNANFNEYAKVPTARLWLPPKEAIDWFRCFQRDPANLMRPRRKKSVVQSTQFEQFSIGRAGRRF